MSRLIDADALIEAVKDYPYGYRGLIVCTIADQPTIEPERKKGKWIKHPEQKNIYGGKCVECSECGEKYVVQHIEYEKYCRNCGADMQKGDKDEN